ncbi:GLPGLI family protein [Chryseobacterium lacus]|uniref:GLPGLI family protein n=1 Tax=Chryseobacterium lacus TaxID=2058346 RepID=UPI000F886C24|nr:GLPGLI family protein [Chryseobacterium lacus]RST27580.1 GLPGLI family protein [Chryseobacterium lacus]
MSKSQFIILFILIFCKLPAQNIVAHYLVMSKFQKDKAVINKDIFILDVVGLLSAFRSETDRRSDSLQSTGKFGLSKKTIFENQINVQKNLGNNKISLIFVKPFMHDKFSVSLLEPLNWKILEDKKIIGKFETQKATVNFGGRKWIAWFCNNIPIHEGPYVFHGLPGLVVQIEDEHQDYKFTLTAIKQSNQNNLFHLKREKEISLEDFLKLKKDYYIDPYADIKLQNIKYQVVNVNGSPIEMNFKQLTENIQRHILKHNNPINLNMKVEY